MIERTAADVVLDDLLPPFPENERMRAYALLDAARDERIYHAVLRADCEWSCLYRGDAAVTMAEVAPYLVQLERSSQFTDWLLRDGWGESWGIFLEAPVPLEILRNHLRRFLYVKLPDERTVYFRFYDPRVLRTYLPTCTEAELETLFGPIERVVAEDEEGRVVSFSRAPQLVTEILFPAAESLDPH